VPTDVAIEFDISWQSYTNNVDEPMRFDDTMRFDETD